MRLAHWKAALVVLASAACADSATLRPTDEGPSQAAAGATAEPDDGAASEDLPELNGCAAADFEDLRADSATRSIAIARGGLTYSPKCMLIASGQRVRWEGSLTTHPLAPGNPSDPRAGSADSPIRATSSGSSVEIRFAEPGLYPYYCTLHAYGSGQGMAGVIRVR